MIVEFKTDQTKDRAELERLLDDGYVTQAQRYVLYRLDYNRVVYLGWRSYLRKRYDM